MKYATRTRPLSGALLALALAGCEAPAPPPAPAPGPEPDPVPTEEWDITELDARGFRALGWGAGDTLWGIDRGRVGWASRTGGRGRLDGVAWDVQAAPGVVSWTDGSGLWLRDGAPAARLVRAARPAAADLTGPEVLWSPGGSRALLSWTGEAVSERAILEGDSVRPLSATLTGLDGAAGAVWLDETRIVLRAVAFGPRAGPPEYREAGYRSDLAVLDVAADRIRRITDAADGEFYLPEGLYAPDTLLAGIRRASAVPDTHVLLDARSGTSARAVLPAGRAAAAHGRIALLRPAPAAAPEPEWIVSLVARSGRPQELMRVRGHAVRLIWHPHEAVLAVAQESEQDGNRTWLVSRK